MLMSCHSYLITGTRYSGHSIYSINTFTLIKEPLKPEHQYGHMRIIEEDLQVISLVETSMVLRLALYFGEK